MTGFQKNRAWLGLAVVSMLSACGGGNSGGIASAPIPPISAPSPTPTPAPTPPPEFQPVPATIFVEPLYNQELEVLGKGWQHDYVSNSSSSAQSQNIRDAGNLTISYDPTTGSYLVSAPVAGSGTLMRTGDYRLDLSEFTANPSVKNATSYCCNTLVVSTADQSQSRFRYVSFIDLYATAEAGPNLNTIGYGTWAVAQPTKAGDVPTTGTARYTGQLRGSFAGDAGATWLEGIARFNFDFASGGLSGDLATSISCFMGCSYEPVTYTFADTNFSRGSTAFSGLLTTSEAPNTGSFSGIFAGPSASELAAQFQLPFLHPELQAWVMTSGVIAAKRN